MSKDKLTLKAIKIVEILRKSIDGMTPPMMVTIKNEYGKDPFFTLIGCLLSLRTRDTLTLPTCRKLFFRAKNFSELLKVPIKELETIIYPVGFYKKKSIILHEVSKDILARFNGVVPQTLEELLSIKGVGRKTANLVLGEAFNIPAICVDTHVHRISNHLGLVKTKTPLETELALQKILPEKYWIEWGKLLVVWGQNVCVPRTHCSKCRILSEKAGIAYGIV